MRHYSLHLEQPFPTLPSREWRAIFAHRIPELAIEHNNDNLLNAILASSATQLLREQPTLAGLFEARQAYLIAAMQQQRTRVQNMTLDDADVVCFASILILVISFAMLQERALGQYTPPLEWLQMGKGAAAVIWMTIKALKDLPDEATKHSAMMVIARSPPHLGFDESYFNPEMRVRFEGVLTQNIQPSGDTWDDETRDTYEKTLSYIGSLQEAILQGEPVYVICRRIQGFALVIPSHFIDLLAEMRPRALVMLAHYFGVVSQVKGVWWLGDGKYGTESYAKREIMAIYTTIPPEWRPLMTWPRDQIGVQA